MNQNFLKNVSFLIGSTQIIQVLILMIHQRIAIDSHISKLMIMLLMQFDDVLSKMTFYKYMSLQEVFLNAVQGSNKWEE